MSQAGAGRNIVWQHGAVSREARPSRGATIWFTGFSGSGKSTIASAVEAALVTRGRPAYLLDGDNVRHGLNADLGFSAEDRAENVRRIAHVAQLLADAGVVALVPVISPYRAGRQFARDIHAAAELPFIEVWVSTPIEECERRDPKGLYVKARNGELRGFTGIDDAYEPPVSPELVLPSHELAVDESVARVLTVLG
ncbi:MAG: adenylyl-sulfate kinase [Ilumatobacteraceae bacterium]